MNHFDKLTHILDEYYALPVHSDTQLKTILEAVQAWQKNRMQAIHVELFSQKDNQALASYFLQRLYGAGDFNILAEQCKKMLGKLEKVQRLIPNAAMDTAVSGVELAMQAIVLDLQLANRLYSDFGSLDAVQLDVQLPLIIKVMQQGADRAAYLVALQNYGNNLDKYIRSFVVYTAFKMAKNKAMQRGFGHLYGFLQEGFVSMQQTKSTAIFIQQFSAKEVAYYQQLSL